MKFSLLFLAFALLISCQKTAQNNSKDYRDLTSKIDSVLANSTFNGAILLTKDSTVLYSKTFGYSDLERETPLMLNDQFVIGSISKQITAALVLRQYEKGSLKLNDKLDKYLPTINQPWSSKVSIHQLLTHTHGIVDINMPSEFEEGSQFQYSQLGYELLAQILESITKRTFVELSSELFAKFELSHTFHPANRIYKNLVKGYEESINGSLEYSQHSLDNYAAAGSFISSAGDLNKWNQLLYSGKLVRPETLELMKTNYATRNHPIFDTVQYGYGLLYKEGEQGQQIGALGYAPGFASACYFYPKSDMNLIVLENTARNLDDFKKTFKVHLQLMELIKNLNLGGMHSL